MQSSIERNGMLLLNYSPPSQPQQHMGMEWQMRRGIKLKSCELLVAMNKRIWVLLIHLSHSGQLREQNRSHNGRRVIQSVLGSHYNSSSPHSAPSFLRSLWLLSPVHRLFFFFHCHPLENYSDGTFNRKETQQGVIHPPPTRTRRDIWAFLSILNFRKPHFSFFFSSSTSWDGTWK